MLKRLAYTRLSKDEEVVSPTPASAVELDGGVQEEERNGNGAKTMDESESPIMRSISPLASSTSSQSGSSQSRTMNQDGEGEYIRLTVNTDSSTGSNLDKNNHRKSSRFSEEDSFDSGSDMDDEADEYDDENQFGMTPRSHLPIVNRHAMFSTSVKPEELDGLLRNQVSIKPLRKETRQFYERQNEQIENLKRVITLRDTEQEEDEPQSRAAYIAIQLSLFLTFLLLSCKLAVAYISGSSSIIAISVDSMLDVLSQGTLLITHRIMHKVDVYNYPMGKARLEPLSIIVFAVIMGFAALLLLYNSCDALYTGLTSGGLDITMDSVSVALIGIVILVQLAMFYYCRAVARRKVPGYTAAQALADDHLNDVCANIVGGIPAIIAGYTPSIWWLDSVGAIVLSIYICTRWTIACMEQFPILIGKSAPSEFLQQLTYISAVHDDRIKRVDTIRAYHIGTNYQCEIHVVVPADLPFPEAHDVGESLEQKIEQMEQVDVAFVHVDFESTHKPEHSRAKRLAVM